MVPVSDVDELVGELVMAVPDGEVDVVDVLVWEAEAEVELPSSRKNVFCPVVQLQFPAR